MGGGNVGGLNTYLEVGVKPALAVGIIDLGKGAAAVNIAYWLLDVCNGMSYCLGRKLMGVITK